MSIRASYRLERGGFRLDADFDAPGQGITALFGPSGCGKTSLLRCIAGLERAAGELYLGQTEIQNGSEGLPVHQRGIAMVFQHAQLFDHLDVAGNLRFAARRSGAPEDDLDRVATLMGLDALRARRTGALSGGERQRVAIARAVLARPRLLLLDEPLAAVDAAGRAGILDYLRQLADSLRLPMIYVSHNLREVVQLADHLLLMQAGRIAASGDLEEMLSRLDLPLEHADDVGAVLSGRVAGHRRDYALTEVDVGGHCFLTPMAGLERGEAVRLRIRARDVSITRVAPEQTSVLNVIPGCVTALGERDAPGQRLVQVDIGGPRILARLSSWSCERLQLAPGTEVYAQIKAVALL